MEAIIPRPLCESYLADHFWFDPAATLHFGSGQTLIPTVPASSREIAPFGRRFWIFAVRIFQSRELEGVKMLRNRCGKCWSALIQCHYQLWITLVDVPVSLDISLQQYEQERQINLSPGWSFRIR